jgi:hypothetical protein
MEKDDMVRNIMLWFTLLGLVLSPALATAAVDMEIIQSLALSEEPLDAIIAPTGRYIFVLTRSGEVIIFNAQGKQTDVIPVGKDIKAIRVGPGDDSILLISPEKREVRLAQVDFIHTINTAGNPYKGDRTAPVAVVVFSDFQ